MRGTFFVSVTGATPGGTTGHLSTTECTYLPTYFMKEEMEYLGFYVGYGRWKPAASKMQPLQDMQIGDDPKKSLHEVRSFAGACNFYRRHIHNFLSLFSLM